MRRRSQELVGVRRLPLEVVLDVAALLGRHRARLHHRLDEEVVGRRRRHPSRRGVRLHQVAPLLEVGHDVADGRRREAEVVLRHRARADRLGVQDVRQDDVLQDLAIPGAQAPLVSGLWHGVPVPASFRWRSMKVSTLGMRVLTQNTPRLFPCQGGYPPKPLIERHFSSLAGLGERGYCSVCERPAYKVLETRSPACASPWPAPAAWGRAWRAGRWPPEGSWWRSAVGIRGSRRGRGGPLQVALADLATAGQDLLLIAVGDGSIAGVAAALAGRPQARVALHTSGSLDASALAPLRAAGSSIGSLHPLKAFPQAAPDPAEGSGVFFAVDGDPAARELAFRLAAAWGASPPRCRPQARPLYHFAATLAAGGVVTLLAAAEEIAGGLGLPEAVTARLPGAGARRLAPPPRPSTPAARSPKPSPAPSPATTARPSAATSRPSEGLTRGKLPLAIFLCGDAAPDGEGRREEGRRLRGAPGTFDSRRLLRNPMTSQTLAQVGQDPDLGGKGPQDQENGKSQEQDRHFRTSEGYTCSRADRRPTCRQAYRPLREGADKDRFVHRSVRPLIRSPGCPGDPPGSPAPAACPHPCMKSALASEFTAKAGPSGVGRPPVGRNTCA